MDKRRLCLPSVEIIKDNEIITDEEIDEWEWKSYHKIDVKQIWEMGDLPMKIIKLIIMLKIIDNYGGNYQPT